MHILSPETDNCPSWISERERMTVENISWSISTKDCCRPRRGLNLRPPGLQSDGASNWATEAGYMSQSTTKPTIRLVWPAKTQVSATSEDSDQPVHPHSLIRDFPDRMRLLQPPGYPKRDKREPLPYWIDVQPDRNLGWSNMSYCKFCRALAHIAQPSQHST